VNGQLLSCADHPRYGAPITFWW